MWKNDRIGQRWHNFIIFTHLYLDRRVCICLVGLPSTRCCIRRTATLRGGLPLVFMLLVARHQYGSCTQSSSQRLYFEQLDILHFVNSFHELYSCKFTLPFSRCIKSSPQPSTSTSSRVSCTSDESLMFFSRISLTATPRTRHSSVELSTRFDSPCALRPPLPLQTRHSTRSVFSL